MLRHRLWRLYKQGLPLAPGLEIAYVVKDAKKWEVDPERTAYEFDADYYRGLLEKAWGEAAFIFKQTNLEAFTDQMAWDTKC